MKKIILSLLMLLNGLAFSMQSGSSFQDVYDKVEKPAKTQLAQLTNDFLKIYPDLSTYPLLHKPSEDDLNNYIEGRLKEDKKATYDLTDEKVAQLLNTGDFMTIFRQYLLSWQEAYFLNAVENMIVDASRPAPINGERQLPTIDQFLRGQNRNLALTAGKKADGLYEQVHEKMMSLQGENSIYK
ncbi:MAG TPA: hypothetical protein VI959_00170 [Alphaproteobacteria bacterium]|nr:hypothetical protein [Alphaproteobacteria bacterium]